MNKSYQTELMAACLAVKPIRGNYTGVPKQECTPVEATSAETPQMEVYKATSPSAIAEAVATSYQVAYEQFRKEYVANGSPDNILLTKAHTDAVQLVLKCIPVGNRNAVSTALNQLHNQACLSEV
ncbi:hypothetical protein [Pseudomonas kurunegalensis]|uniref:hypothetical protein n=1 Tax=Pseudomonas kurunegalensis TaxID=485880 RepID=UPI003D803C56